MSNLTSFNSIFKKMLRYVGQAANTEENCPMTTIILSQLIEWLFDNPDRASKIMSKFIENRVLIDEKYRSGRGESFLVPESTSYADALKRRDRSLFKHIDLFPGDIASKYPDQIDWFSKFLVNKMQEKHMHFVWMYLDKINKEAGMSTM